MTSFFSWERCLALVWLLILTLSTVIHLWDLDLQLAAQFYGSETEQWFGLHHQPWKWLYDHGPLLGLFLFFVSTFLGIRSIFQKSEQKRTWAAYWFVISLTGLLGGALIINTVLKEYWGRPRPRQVQAFGGKWEYRPITQPGIPGRGHSFVCGHCASGFVLGSTLVLYAKIGRWALLSGGAGLLYGLLMSAARIMQGGHFLSDTLWSFGIMFTVAGSLYYWVFRLHENGGALFPLTASQKRYVWTWITLLGLPAVGMSLIRPVYADHYHLLSLKPEHKQVLFETTLQPEQVSTHPSPYFYGIIRTEIRGFGPVTTKPKVHIQRDASGASHFSLGYEPYTKGLILKETRHAKVFLPEGVQLTWQP